MKGQYADWSVRYSEPARIPGLFRAWNLSVTVGECIGFCIPALVGALVMGQAAPVAFAALVLAGSLEGAVLAWSQARVLRQPLRRLSSRRWIVNTSAAAALAWSIGMLPSTAHDLWSRWPVPLIVVAAAVLGLVLLCSIGTAQWFELRRHVPRAGRWVPATAAAWCAGLMAFSAVTSPLWQPGQRPALVAAIGALGGLVMALTVAVGTGWALIRLLRTAQAHQVSVAIPAGPRSRSDRPWKNVIARNHPTVP
jgi:hypothetical protein